MNKMKENKKEVVLKFKTTFIKWEKIEYFDDDLPINYFVFELVEKSSNKLLKKFTRKSEFFNKKGKYYSLSKNTIAHQISSKIIKNEKYHLYDITY